MKNRESLEKLKQFNRRLEQIQLDASSIKEQFFTKDTSNINIIVNRNGEIVEMGDGMLQHLGYTKDEVLGNSFLDFVYKKDKVRTVEIFNNKYDLNDDFVYRNRYVAKDGSLKTLEWHQAIHKGNFVYASAKVIPS